MSYYTYILECADKTLYVGITTDLERRVTEHNNKKVGAHYTKTRRPVSLVYNETFSTRSEALKREHQIRTMTRAEKLRLINAIISLQ